MQQANFWKSLSDRQKMISALSELQTEALSCAPTTANQVLLSTKGVEQVQSREMSPVLPLKHPYTC